MRILHFLAAMIIPVAHAACGGDPTVRDRAVRDWGLHRAWRVTADCEHPERPPVLVEIPWTTPGKQKGDVHVPLPAAPPLVRAGMRVVVTWQDPNSHGSLTGTALATAGLGQTVAVRTGPGQGRMRGVVCGPGRVELDRGKAGH